MTSIAQQAELIRRRLYATNRGRYAKLKTNVTIGGTQLHFEDDVDQILVGSLIGIEQEIMLVRAVDKAARVCTVERGFYGTESVHHDLVDALAEISPRFPLPDIVDTMKEEVLSWSPELWRPITVSIDTTYTKRTYDIPGARRVLFGLDAELVRTDTCGGLYPSESRVAYRLVRALPRADYPSTFAVQLTRDPGQGSLRFTYAGPFDTTLFDPLTELEDDVGLQPEMLDVLKYGTLWRLMSGREVGRADMHAAGEVRKAEEVPAGLQTQIASSLLKLRDRRLADCALSLRSDWPYVVQ